MTLHGCSLGAVELDAQLARLRELGRHAQSVERVGPDIVVRFGGDPPASLLDRVLAVERGCCPFLLIDYDARDRRLAISVDPSEDHAALDALAHALT